MLLSEEGHANGLKEKCLLFWWVMKISAGTETFCGQWRIQVFWREIKSFAKCQVTSNVLYVSNWLHKELESDHKALKNFSKRALESSNRLLEVRQYLVSFHPKCVRKLSKSAFSKRTILFSTLSCQSSWIQKQNCFEIPKMEFQVQNGIESQINL